MRYKVENNSKSTTVTCTLKNGESLYLYPKDSVELKEEQFTDYFNGVPFITVEVVKEKSVEVADEQLKVQEQPKKAISKHVEDKSEKEEG